MTLCARDIKIAELEGYEDFEANCQPSTQTAVSGKPSASSGSQSAVLGMLSALSPLETL